MNAVAGRFIRFGAALGAALNVACAEPRQVVINEIMYHPPGDLENLQYIELFNASNEKTVGWTTKCAGGAAEISQWRKPPDSRGNGE